MGNPSGINVVAQMLEFYSLREHPFGVSPDPRFLYPSYQHREAMASLIFGIESQVGFAALIAEPGSGKTTLLFDLLQRYRERANTAFIFNTQCNGLELLRQVVIELEVPGAEELTDIVRLHQLFTSFVASHMGNRPMVIIIDEAQNLENSALETLRLLSNFEAADRKLLHIILAGQPQLADKLRHPSLTQLLQRITIVSRLERFSRQQMEECIAFRLRVAGYGGAALFTEQALDRVIDASRGVPREVNRICMNSMQLGFVLRQQTIGVDIVDEVLSDLTLAKWAHREESHLDPHLAPMAPPAHSGAFRVGGRSLARPASPPPAPFADDPLVERGYVPLRTARLQEQVSSGQEYPPPETDDVDPLRPLEESNLRRALLDAAVRRRRAAELRLLGLQTEDGHVPPASKGGYPYKFAMGCIPNPPAGKPEPSNGSDERFQDRPGRPGSTSQSDAERQEDTRKKTGS
jgi:general secretion pathway protein A